MITERGQILVLDSGTVSFYSSRVASHFYGMMSLGQEMQQHFHAIRPYCSRPRLITQRGGTASGESRRWNAGLLKQ